MICGMDWLASIIFDRCCLVSVTLQWSFNTLMRSLLKWQIVFYLKFIFLEIGKIYRIIANKNLSKYLIILTKMNSSI